MKKKMKNIEIKNYYNIFNLQISGYNKIKDTNYWNWNTDEKSVFIALLWNSTRNLLELLNKIDEKDIEDSDFIKILENYKKYINKDFEFSTIEKL